MSSKMADEGKTEAVQQTAFSIVDEEGVATGGSWTKGGDVPKMPAHLRARLEKSKERHTKKGSLEQRMAKVEASRQSHLEHVQMKARASNELATSSHK